MTDIILKSTYYVINRPVCKVRDEQYCVLFFTYDGDFIRRVDLLREERNLKKSARLDAMLDPKYKNIKVFVDRVVFQYGYVYFVDKGGNVFFSHKYGGELKLDKIVSFFEKNLVDKNFDLEHFRKKGKVVNYHDDSCVIL